MAPVLVCCGVVALWACGGSEPLPAAPCPAASVVAAPPPPAPSPSVVASAAPTPSAELPDPNISRGVIGDAQCLRYEPGYPEYLALHCVLAKNPAGHPEYVFASLTRPDSFVRVDTADSTAEGIDKDLALRAPRAFLSRVAACYDDALAKTPSLNGTIVVEYEIDAKGNPQKIKSGGGTLKAPDVIACTTKLIAKLHYPEIASSKGAAKITFSAALRTASTGANEGHP